ncbi:MAG: helix-turn-helix transcriptional regulator [Cyclobacteriaceae bacterium]|nr:helix-turn-helix transcriptional regulator [Cyclobacteriaceae bacterium]
MKQPLLGQKIQEWRRARGLTQEELVERCNINVRTIQRIEAGEVTPRSYTVKAILEVLEVNPEEIPNDGFEVEEPNKGSISSWLRFSFIAGIVYLIFVIAETLFDIYLLSGKSSLSLVWGYAYTFLKSLVLILFILFTFGFYKLGDMFSNLLLKTVVILLMIATSVFIVEDVVAYWMGKELMLELVLRSLVIGVLYVLFAVCLLQLSKKRGNLYLITGVLGILSGLSFLSLIFFIPGLIMLTLFEIMLVVLLYEEFKSKTIERISKREVVLNSIHHAKPTP